MAKIHEDIAIIKFSQLVKDDSQPVVMIHDEVLAALVQVAEELVGTGVIVEIEKHSDQ